MTIFLLASVLCVPAFATESEEDDKDKYDVSIGDKVDIDEEDITAIEVAGDGVWWWGHHGLGSLFGEGSLTMIVALLALIASGVAIFLVVYYNKKKAVPVAVNKATEADEE